MRRLLILLIICIEIVDFSSRSLAGQECEPYSQTKNNIEQLWQSGDYVAAKDLLDCAIEVDPDQAEIYLERAYVNLLLNDVDEAQADVSTAIELSIDNPRIYFNAHVTQARLMLFAQDYDEAAETLAWILDYAEEQEDLIRDEQLAQVHKLLGELDVLQDRPEDAIVHFDRATDYSPDAEYYFFKGIAYHLLEEDSLAEENLEAAVALDPHVARYFVSEGKVFNILGNNQLAAQYYTFALLVEQPSEWETYALRGISYYLDAQYDTAIDDLEYVLEVAPEEQNVLFFLGCAKVEVEEYQSAIEDLSALLAVNPIFPETYLCRGNAYYEIGANADALEDYEMYLDLAQRFEEFDVTIDPIAKSRVQELSGDDGD